MSRVEDSSEPGPLGFVTTSCGKLEQWYFLHPPTGATNVTYQAQCLNSRATLYDPAITIGP